MQKLIRYSQIAKSYAIKRDDEAVRMRENLSEAEARVKEMEQRVSELANELGRAKSEDDVQGGLLDELAKQTAQALRYKQRAEKYQAALEHDERLRFIDAGSVDVPVQPHAQTKSRKTRDETAAEEEVQELRKNATSLEEENARLRATIGRVKDEMKRYEQRHKVWLQERRRKDEKSNARKKALREQLAMVEEENSRLVAELKLAKGASSNHSDAKPSHETRDAGQLAVPVPTAATASRQLEAPLRSQAGNAFNKPDTGDLPRSGGRNRVEPRQTSHKPMIPDNLALLRKRLEEKMSSSVVQAHEETMDLCNLQEKSTKGGAGYTDKAVICSAPGRDRSSRPVSIASPAYSPAGDLLRRSSTSQTRQDGHYSARPIKPLSERVLAARQDLAAILPEKEPRRRGREESKENARRLVAT